jgi:hypothetical protein
MFGFFKEKKQDESVVHQDFVYDQALLLRIPLSDKLGNDTTRQKVIDFEDKVALVLPDQSGVLSPSH